MNLTREQEAAVRLDARRMAVVGGHGSGKTAIVRARYERLLHAVPPSRVLVVCRDRAAAQRFTLSVLPTIRGGFDALPISTAFGLAFDVLARASSPTPRLADTAEERATIRSLLAAEDVADWPVLGRFLTRPAFIEEVRRGLRHLRAAGHDAAERAGGPWLELARFDRRYRARLAGAGCVDADGLFHAATACLRASPETRFAHVLVDDVDALPPAAQRMLGALASPAVFTTASSALAAPETCAHGSSPPTVVTLGSAFRAQPPGRLVRSNHPSIEAEAIAGELLAAHDGGVAWSAMAVLVRDLGRRARSIGRALARHGVPVVPVPSLAPDEPVVEAVLDALRWSAGDETALDRLLVSPLARMAPLEVRAVRAGSAEVPARLLALREHLARRIAAGSSPADLAYEVWARELPTLGESGLGAVDDRALDALVALVDGLAVFATDRPRAGLADALAAFDEGGLAPDPWRAASSIGPGGVTISSIAGSAGREWHTVVVAGCVEGELPRARPRRPLFDPAALGPSAADPADDRADDRPDGSVDERRLFALATSRATACLIATAAPEPGVLLSRFVEAWPEADPRLPLAPGQAPPRRPVTANDTPVSPDGRLRLSASQLDTYDDCPLRYAYQYVLRARDEPGVHASLGTVAHEILAAFLDPESGDPPPRTFEGLVEVANRLWRDDIARYRPQLEEARRDLLAMLQNWWEREGASAPDVLAVERRFEVGVGPHRLAGSIDRVDRVEGGLRIVDYKTGKSEPKPGDVADDLQLAVYHLAAARDLELAALGPAVQLQLHYLRSMHRYDQPVTEDHEERTEARVVEVAERILAEDFAPAVDANCRTCSFHRLCPLQDEGRQVGVG